jgi:hypothetical protein
MLNLWKLLTLSVRMCTFAGGGGLFGGGGDGGGGTSQTTQDIPEWLKPYVTFGLDEAQSLYKGAGPDYFPGQTYLDPSQQTQSALQLAEQRARAGSPLQQAALQQQQQTVGGDYLSQSNPYLNQALAGARDIATQGYYDALKGGRSGAVMAGRMGSGAQQDVESRAEQNLANALASQAGQLRYQDYASERARQESAALNAPAMAASEYQDINQLLQTGQTGEAYDQAALEADVARFNFGQQKPYEKLSSYLGAVYGAPVPIQSTTTQETSGGGKIICTAMNQAYGFGSFRNAVWLKYSQEKLKKEHEVGYHTLFLPLVKISYKMGNKWHNKAVRTVLEHLVKHRTKDIYQESKGKKRDTLGRIYRNIFEPLCYLVGKIKGVK